jgi:hypothetical protein
MAPIFLAEAQIGTYIHKRKGKKDKPVRGQAG